MTMMNDETHEPRHLLIVEDDAAFARTLKRSFERRGYTVRPGRHPGRDAGAAGDPHARLRGGRPEAQRRGFRPGLRAAPARARRRDADRGADRLCQHRHRGRGHQAGRLPLPGQALQHRRHRGRLRPRRGQHRGEHDQPRRPRSRRWNGSASTRRWPRPASTSRKPRAAWACTGARWRASWKSSGSSSRRLCAERREQQARSRAVPSVSSMPSTRWLAEASVMCVRSAPRVRVPASTTLTNRRRSVRSNRMVRRT